jgi:hypothetical protein
MTDPSRGTPQNVSRNRFEFDEDGETAYLEFDVDGQGWLTLWHTEVPPSLRGRGIAGVLAQTAFEYAREHNLKVDVICPLAQAYVEKHPEYKDLIGK